MKREIYIDMAKGVALIFIIVSHSLFAYDLPIDCVPVFYFCAGYTSRLDFSIAGKARRILLPYLIISLLCLAFTYRYFQAFITREALIGILYSRFTINIEASPADWVRYMPLFNAVTWFLTSFFTSYCVYKVILKFRGHRLQLAACAISIFIAWGMDFLPVLLPWSIDTAFFFAPIMWLGARARQTDFFSRVITYRFAGIVLLFLTSYVITGHINLSIRDYGSGIIASFIYTLAGVVLVIYTCRALENIGITLPLTRALNRRALYVYGLQMIMLDRGENYGIRIGRKVSLLRDILAPDSLGLMIFQIVFAIVAGYMTACVIELMIELIRKRVAPSPRCGLSRPTRR